MAANSWSRKSQAESLKVASTVQSLRPLIAVFGAPESFLDQIKYEFKGLPFELLSASNFEQIHALINNQSIAVGVVFDKGIRDPLALISLGKNVSKAKWILFSRHTSIQFRAQALGRARVDVLMEYPIHSNRALHKIRQLAQLAHIEANHHRPKVLHRAPVPSLSLLRDSAAKASVGIETLPAHMDYLKRRNWMPFSRELFLKASVSSDALEELLEAALYNVLRDLRQLGRISLISFGVDSPLIDPNPSRFVVLSSSDEIPLPYQKAVFDTQKYPELVQAVARRMPIIAKDIREAPLFGELVDQIERTGTRSLAAIPLYRGTNLFGILKARMSDVNDREALSILADLNAYSRDMAPFASQYDFFRRIYRRLKTSA